MKQKRNQQNLKRYTKENIKKNRTPFIKLVISTLQITILQLTFGKRNAKEMIVAWGKFRKSINRQMERKVKRERIKKTYRRL